MSSGIVFKSETHVLMGYQPDKNMISGIGGKPIGNETPIQTAFRETVEELFGVQPSPEVVDALSYSFNLRIPVVNSNYTMFIYTIDDLVQFLYIAKSLLGSSPYYQTFPLTLNALILDRRAPPNVEVTYLALIPIIQVPFHVDQRDMKIIG